jgi:integrase
VQKSAHGLRKALAIALADAGATTHQISAWTGHESLKEIEHYTRQSNRRRAVMGQVQEPKCANTSGKM